MTAERWDRIKSICGEVLELAPGSRAEAVAAACAGDAELRAEVERLIRNYEDASSKAWEPAIRVKESDPLPPSFGPGETIAGKYRIVRHLGTGGMGEVYEAAGASGPVALKIVRLGRAGDELMQRRLRREGLLGKRLEHPHICRLLDTATHETAAGPMSVLVMELLPGETLRERLSRSGPLGMEETYRLGTQMAAALDAAHAAGVIHRDFKPSNVMLTPDGRAVVMDFGLATGTPLAGWSESTLTSSGVLVGTLEYMAPEQLREREVTPRADLYALGSVLFEMLTGAKPSQGRQGVEEILRRCMEPPPEARQFAPAISGGWNAMLRRALDPDPAQRYASGQEMMWASQVEPPRSWTKWWIAAAVLAAATTGWWTFHYYRQPRPGFRLAVASPQVKGASQEEVAFLWNAALGQSNHYQRVNLPEATVAKAAAERCAFLTLLAIEPRGSAAELTVTLERAASPRQWRRVLMIADRKGLRPALQQAADLVRSWTGDPSLGQPQYQRRLGQITTESDDALRYYLAGEALAGQNRPAAAEEFIKALQFDPKFALAHMRLGFVLTGMRDHRRSAAHHEQALEAVREGRTSYCEALRIQGMFAIDMGDFRGAAAPLAERARTCAPEVGTHFYLAEAYWAQGRKPEAQREVSEILREDATNTYALDLASRWAFLERDASRLGDLVTRMKLAPHRLRWTGLLRQLEGRTKEAQESFAALCRPSAENAESFRVWSTYGCNLWAHSLADDGQNDQALRVLVEATKEDQRAARMDQVAEKSIASAWLCLQLGRRTEARTHAAEALEMNPDPRALSLLARVLRLVGQTKTLNELAARLAGMERYPRYHAALWRVEAEAATARGDYREAARRLAEVIDREPPGTERVSLALAYISGGDQERGEELLRAERSRQHEYWTSAAAGLPGYVTQETRRDRGGLQQ